VIVVEVKLNTQLIAMYGMTRIEDGPEPEKLNTYKVGRFFPDSMPVRDSEELTLQHRYDDPVEQLVTRAIALAEEKFGPAPRLP
jgi:hypothetical protein